METQGHLIVDIARLDREGESFTGETAADILELGEHTIFQPVGGIVFDIHVEQIDGELLARGHVAHHFRCPCSRCAEEFTLVVEEPDFFANHPIEEGTEYVDLTPDMREAIIIALPGYPVCREDCKGLCAGCGANRNREACTCGPAPGGGGSWAGLDLLGKR